MVDEQTIKEWRKAEEEMVAEQPLLGYTFFELVNYVEEIQTELEHTKTLLAEARSQSTNKIIKSMQNEQKFLMETISTWEEIADGIYEGLMQAEDQLAGAGHALRPFAQEAVQRYRSMYGNPEVWVADEVEETEATDDTVDTDDDS